MISRYFYGALAVAILVALASMTTFAQVAELRGKVMMKQADGQTVPLADAQIDVFRMDMNAKYQTKTNKKGEFVFAGLPFIGTYTVAASHPTAAPTFVGGVRPGGEADVELVVGPGDGKRLTVEDVRAAGANTGAAGPGGRSAGGGGGGESAADKAKREELLKKNAEIEATNKKISESNEIIARTFKAGNESLTAASAASKAKNSEEAIQKYTAAVTSYDEGLAADAEQPAILTNKAVALKGRGVERFNSTITSKLDDTAKTAGLQAAREDFKAAAETSGKAVTMLKAQPAPTDPNDVQRYNSNKYAAMLTHSESMRLYVTKGGGGAEAEAGVAAFKDYIAVEMDPAKKAKAQVDMAQMLLDAGAADKALAEFKAILAATPDNPEANLGAGLAVYGTGDKTKYQEAANFIQRFVETAPDTHPMKDDAKAVLQALKESENVTPEKTSRPARKRP